MGTKAAGLDVNFNAWASARRRLRRGQRTSFPDSCIKKSPCVGQKARASSTTPAKSSSTDVTRKKAGSPNAWLQETPPSGSINDRERPPRSFVFNYVPVRRPRCLRRLDGQKSNPYARPSLWRRHLRLFPHRGDGHLLITSPSTTAIFLRHQLQIPRRGPPMLDFDHYAA